MGIIYQQKSVLPDIRSLQIEAAYNRQEEEEPSRRISAHIHPECEIYVNVSCNVSFLVENTLYAVPHGGIVLTRPYENHHCIYHDNETHEHYWILFSSNGNEDLLPMFFQREIGTNNLYILPEPLHTQFIGLCETLCREQETPLNRYLTFFRILELLLQAETEKPQSSEFALPEKVQQTVTYMKDHLNQPITMTEAAEQSHISVNTMERYFHECLNCGPMEYLKQLRMTHAASCLRMGKSVSEACFESGCEYSHFIRSFKKTFGMTPLQYKKSEMIKRLELHPMKK